MELLDYEIKHIEYCLNNAHESTLFLKRNDDFPINKPCRVALFGNGARNTIKGGTGSGDVVSRCFVTFEQGLINKGFEITTSTWLDQYQIIRDSWRKSYVKRIKKEARQKAILAAYYCMGAFENEHDYDLDISTYNGDIAIYVLSRNSGEGNDRRIVKGDVLLSDTEIKDINYLNSKFKKFMLVLNVGGVIDLSPVINVKNILYISQLGVVTGDILPRILLGEVNPSGKLSTTWSKINDYHFIHEFGDINDTYYKEGIHVGYKYFESKNIHPYFEFGYGLSYTDFKIEILNIDVDNSLVNLKIKVTNIGNFDGKEVVQIYLHCPKGKLDKPYSQLIEFEKTKLLKPNEAQIIDLSFDLISYPSYDEEKSSYVLEKGNYVVSVGNSSINLTHVLKLKLNNDVIIEKLENKLGKTDFNDYINERYIDENIDIPTFIVDLNNYQTKNVIYKKEYVINNDLLSYSDEQLMLLTLGHFGKGLASVVGDSSKHAPGAAGETTLKIPQLNKSLVLADGPAGLRLKQTYGIDNKGIYDIVCDPIVTHMVDFLPLKAITKHFIAPDNSKRKGEIHHQFTTAIPIGTALAQSFNKQYVYEIGTIIKSEMEYFNVDLWLAPAINIHRNILCGRNFEYYSEDPYLSGVIASFITKGVQENSNKVVTIKHFAANNQEINRNNNNSHVSERALREIYLKPFEIAIKNGNAKAIMTSYNLINGVHTSESKTLLEDILRIEWGFDGLVMSDWIASGRHFCFKNKYKDPFASNNLLAGNDLTMPGCNADLKDLKRAMKSKKINRNDLLKSASRIYNFINSIK